MRQFLRAQLFVQLTQFPLLSFSNRPTSWNCLASSCSGLSFDPKHYCNGSGTCVDPPNTNCSDGPGDHGVPKLCTDDSCNPSTGCIYTNNNEVYEPDCYKGTPSSTKGQGVCIGGIENCYAGKNTGVCVGQITPTTEICDDKDNDCDTITDEESTDDDA